MVAVKVLESKYLVNLYQAHLNDSELFGNKSVFQNIIWFLYFLSSYQTDKNIWVKLKSWQINLQLFFLHSKQKSVLLIIYFFCLRECFKAWLGRNKVGSQKLFFVDQKFDNFIFCRDEKLLPTKQEWFRTATAKTTQAYVIGPIFTGPIM